MKAIECKGLHAAYDRKRLGTDEEVLRGISISIEVGRRVSILGENGSGKSTLLKALTAMIPYQGELKILDRDVTQMKRKDIAASVSFLSQLSQIFFSYTVYDCVLMGRYIHVKKGFSRYSDEDRRIAEECMRRTGVYALADRQLFTLSGGEQQRVFLARTFAQDSPVLILDEPTNHLDLKVVAGMSEYLMEWSRQEGHTLIGVYHDIPLALDLSDELILMKDGRVAAAGRKEELLARGELEKAYDFDVRGYLRSIMGTVV
ncbi:MAG: ABC transporter ATP-binding protein [Lachnospiraceae bacterium]|nr:ABC transporter ATP-binding protein [Lachnospiraceae bacterium]